MASGDVKVELNLEPLIKSIKQLDSLKKPINDSLFKLATAAFQQGLAFANQKLKKDPEHKLYLDSYHIEKNSSGGYDRYLIILEEPALYIEDGSGDIDMRKTHLKGREYLRIPFKHKGGPPAKMNSKQDAVMKEIKQAMKDNKISIGKPIMDKAGNPILSSKINPKPAATMRNVKSAFKGSVSGQSILNNMNIYQTPRTKKTGGTAIDKTFITYRTLSKNSKAKWVIPGKPGLNIFNEIYKWIEQNYQSYLDDALKSVNLVVG